MPNVFDLFFDLAEKFFDLAEKLIPILTTNIYDLFLDLPDAWRITINIMSLGTINLLKYFNFNILSFVFISIGVLLIFKFIKKFVPAS